MRDLDGPLADRDQPALRERREHLADVLVALQVELGERGAPADGCVALVPDQAQHHAAHELFPALRNAGVRALREPRDGAMDPPNSR